jgi:hypothetical protein
VSHSAGYNLEIGKEYLARYAGSRFGQIEPLPALKIFLITGDLICL